MKMTAAKSAKIKIGVTATVLFLVVVVAVIILCESLGVFPGVYIDRIAVNAYMNKAHDGVEYTVISQSFVKETENKYGTNQKDNYYLYKCRLDNTENSGEIFEIKSYGFKVTSDGYYKNYLRNKELESKVNDTISREIVESYDASSPHMIEGVIFNVDCNAVLTYEKYGTSCDDELVTEILSSLKDFELEIFVKGNKISYDEYSELAADVVKSVYTDLGYEPVHLRILYYREPEQGETPDENDVVKNGLIMAYESSIESYQLSFDIANASGMHYFVELGESEAKKMKAYNIVKNVYLIVVAGTVVALTALWSVRKFKKWSKEIKSYNILHGTEKQNEDVVKDKSTSDTEQE